jgi:Fumarylacetoacetate (FAA) hydrolase family
MWHCRGPDHSDVALPWFIPARRGPRRELPGAGVTCGSAWSSAACILTTGTISGVAAVQFNPFEFYLQPGDSIEAEIEGVGLLRNQVVPWAAAHTTPAPNSTDLNSPTS